ncbi:unnamed protein product [Phytophthora fragariaefolia]|uniref:Unnamed protein product n=1 Tax=Phytophthora fragariaefolia TaxID=1490495 RepID=A0A9W6YAX2_9STRA|nr:unnamed protein product [Phytophthora fragariaefolia]
MQKHFLWKGLVSTDSCRHKLAAPADKHKKAWQIWLGISLKRSKWQEPLVTPRIPQRHKLPGGGLSQQQLFYTDVGNWLAPTQAEAKERQQRLQTYWTHISSRVTAWIEYEDEWAARFAIILPDDFRNPMDPAPLHIQQAWHTWTWADNPWVPDVNKPTVARRTYHRIAVTAMQQLAVSRDLSRAYTVRVPKATPNGRLHRVATLARWAVAILYAAPSRAALTTGSHQAPVQLRHDSLMEGIYSWHFTTPETILAVPTTSTPGQPPIRLLQDANQINWIISPEDVHREEAVPLKEYSDREGVVFHYHPSLHSVPWQVVDEVRNKHVYTTLKKQPFRKVRTEQGVGLAKPIQRVQLGTTADDWEWGLQSQRPNEI